MEVEKVKRLYVNESVSNNTLCYNVEKYLGQCLDTVFSQTLNDIEIICINDGSTDSTLEILTEYKKKITG